VSSFKLYGADGNGGARRTGRRVVVLLIVSAAAALFLARALRVGVSVTVVELLVGGGAPAGLYMTWRQTRKSESADETPFDDEASLTESVLKQLANTVTKQWDKEYKARTFNDPGQASQDIRASWSAADARLTVSWKTLVSLASGTGAHPGLQPGNWALDPQGLAGLDEGDLCEILEKVPTGWLAVLGESGSGKTMLMLRTVREILKHRTASDPVPVFVPMTSWDPETDSLRAWLEQQLPVDYPALRASVTLGAQRTSRIGMLLDEQKIMPVLDGLDEMPVYARVEAITRLNEAFCAPDRPLRLVVTCRTADYKQAVTGEKGWSHNPIEAAAAIELHRLDVDKVSSYLARRGDDPRWSKGDPRLSRRDSRLAKALDTPLYASLASEIYNPARQSDRSKPRKPEELCRYRSEKGVQQHLLDEFIPAVFAGKRKHQEMRTAEVGGKPARLSAERCLMILAAHLTENPKEPNPNLDWWNLRQLAPSWVVPMVIGVACGVPTAYAAATGTHVGVGIGIGFGTGMLIAVAIGILAFRLRRGWDEHRVRCDRLSQGTYDGRYLKRRPGPGMTGGMIGAVIGGLAAGVAGAHHIGHQASLFSGVPEALGMALGAGASTDFFGGFAGVLIGGFAGGYLAGVGLGLPAGVVNGLGVAVAVAFAIEQVGRDKQPSPTRPTWDKGIGIVGGSVIGLATGLIVWREAGIAYGVAFGALTAALAAAPFGLRHEDADLDHVPSPGEALARDAKAFQLTALSAGLAAGMVGFIGGSITSITEVHGKVNVGSVISDGLGIGVAAGIVVGLAFGFYHAASPEFRIITWWLALQGKAPWRFKHFLEEAYELTVLRQSGASYQFRHIELQKRLAARFREGQDNRRVPTGPPSAAPRAREANQTVPSSAPAQEPGPIATLGALPTDAS
jgi:hypothetical protein